MRADWGTPPKPYAWHAHINHDTEQLTVTSPLIEGSIIVTFNENNWFLSYVSPSGSVLLGQYGELEMDALTNEFYKKYVAKHIESGKIKKKVPKLATSVGMDLKVPVMWGDPPKPYLWRVAIQEYAEHRGKFTIASPMLVRPFTIVLEADPQDFRNIGKILMYPSKLVYHKNYVKGRTTDDMVKNAFGSHDMWHKAIKPFLVRNNLLKEGLKLASDNLKAMWGDPPKPFLWEVSRSGRDLAFTSPLVEGKIIIKTNTKANFVIHYGPLRLLSAGWYTTEPFETTMARILSNDFYKKYILDLINRGHIKTKVPKLASDNLKAMWGDPPKPYLWKLKVGEGTFMRGSRITFFINSPILTHTIKVDVFKHQVTYSADSKGADSDIDSNKITTMSENLYYLSSFYDVYEDVLSPRGWARIKDFVLQFTAKEGMKLASED